MLTVCVPALAPTFLPGWFEGHDDLHVYRLIQYDIALKDGQVPPRWFPDVSAGYGNPHPIYYAPLFYYTAEIFHLSGLGIIASLKASIFVFMVIAAAGMYAYARPLFGPAGAIVAASAYTYAPYHLLDLYVRKALSELTVFALLPLLLLAFRNLRERGSRSDVIAGALALAGMSIAHTISTMMVPALLGAYAICLSLGGPRNGRRAEWTWLPRAAAAVGIGYAIAGFFLAPAFLERNAINLRIYTEAYVDYQKHFVYPQQLIWWPWGFGMSLDGLKDQMSFRLGVLQIIGAVIAALGLSALRRRPDAWRHATFYLVITAFAVFMMLPVSAPVWGLFPPLKFVQFPWRFLTITTLSTGFLCGAAYVAWGPSPARGKIASAHRRAWIAPAAIASLFALSAALGGMLGVNLRVPVARVGFEEKPYNNMVDRGPSAAESPETMDGAFVRRHTLRWIDHLPPGVSFMGLDARDLERPKVEIVRGPATITDLTSRSWMVRFRVEAAAETRVRVNIYRFPGWTVRLDGKPVEMTEPPRDRRVITFDVPEGSHDASVTFERTPARWIGDLMSLAGLAVLATIGLWPRRATAT